MVRHSRSPFPNRVWGLKGGFPKTRSFPKARLPSLLLDEAITKAAADGAQGKQWSMIPRVLMADPDRALLETVGTALSRYREIFALHTASAVPDAIVALKDETFSLLIADASMSITKGPLLVDYVASRHPLLPVIVTGRPEALAQCAQEVGKRYLACMSKPFALDRLAERILVAIDWEADGGTLHEISTFFVPQMIEMEKKTCTVKVTSVSSARHGILFFSQGVLVDALCEGNTGTSAACAVFSWDKVKIVIHNSCSSVERRINSPVTAILLEAMRLRDEAQEEDRKQSLQTPPLKAATHQQSAGQRGMAGGRRSLTRSTNKLHSALAAIKGVGDIYRDDSWNYLLELSQHVGGALKIGPLKVAFVTTQEQDSNLVLIPGKDTTVVLIEKYSLKEEILERVLLLTKER
jgi:CheY-like chemotaxis protein